MTQIVLTDRRQPDLSRYDLAHYRLIDRRDWARPAGVKDRRDRRLRSGSGWKFQGLYDANYGRS